MIGNKLRETMETGKLAIGMFNYTASPAFVEILGYSGFDFVIIDTEHTSIDFRTAEHLIRAAESSGITPLIRVYENTCSLINKALNFGAKGIVVPHVNTEEQAKLAVQFTKYPPVGARAACPGTRAAGYSIENWKDYYAQANRDTLVILLLEGKEALENLDALLSVSGVDVVFVGPWDLSQSLGVPGQAYDHPAVVKALDDVVSKAMDKGISVMTVPLPTWTNEKITMFRDRGVNMICFPDDFLIFSDAVRRVAKLKELAKAVKAN